MQKVREHWSSHLGFILAAAGSAIGLGTLWKFPYVTGENGGGLFVLIYMACILFIGIPVFIAELTLGRKAQRGAVGIFQSLSDNSSVWKAAGWIGVLASFLLISYYSVVAGWGLNYVFMSLNQFYQGRTTQEISQTFDILLSSGDIVLFWHFVFMALTVAIVYRGIRQGIEYWSKFMTIGLLVLLLCMCAYAMTLDGFGQAVSFLFSPDYTKFKPSAALEALGLGFFTLSLGQGIMLTYGSYMRRSEDIPKTAGIIGIMIVVVSLLAGMTIFPIVFSFGFEPEGGPGLVFKTLPPLFAQLPGALIISVTFFILFTFTALTSSVAMIEAMVANFIDLFGWSRHKATIISGISAFIAGIPSALSNSTVLFANWSTIYGKDFFSTMDNLVSVWLMPIAGLMVALFTGWVLDKEIAKEEFQAGTAFKGLWKTWLFFIRWIAPIAIIAIMMQSSGLIDIDNLLKK